VFDIRASKCSPDVLRLSYINEPPRNKLKGINRKNWNIYLPAVKNLSEKQSKPRGIEPPMGD